MFATRCLGSCHVTGETLLENSAASVEYATAFLRLVNAFRSAKKDDILTILRHEDNEQIVYVCLFIKEPAVISQRGRGAVELVDYNNYPNM